MAAQKFKVIIAGGSIAGLALANMLEQNDIDFIVLEKYGQIAPQLGAAIAVLANGARILDQIGCLERLEAPLENGRTFEHLDFRSYEGKVLLKGEGWQQHLLDKFGWGYWFIERKTLVQGLFDNIRNKDKVLVNKGVARVEQYPGGVKVFTTDGDSFSGDILVGADGVHSAVRKEMWRIGDLEKPGYFDPRERNNVPCNVRAVFGTSEKPPGMRMDRISYVEGDGFCHLLQPGQGRHIYWYLSESRAETTHGLYDKIPRWSEAEKDELLAQRADDIVSDGLTFGALTRDSSSSIMTAIPEYVMSKWHYGRIVTLGDASAKYNPLVGMGGNSSIEEAAILTNHLHKTLRDTPEGSLPSDENISRDFRQLEQLFVNRAKMLMKEGTMAQWTFSRASLISRFLASYVVPFLGIQGYGRKLWSTTRGGARLDMFDVAEKQSEVQLFDDQRPSLEWLTSSNIVALTALAGVSLALWSTGRQPLPVDQVVSFGSHLGSVSR